jgi:hypothetical protein
MRLNSSESTQKLWRSGVPVPGKSICVIALPVSLHEGKWLILVAADDGSQRRRKAKKVMKVRVPQFAERLRDKRLSIGLTLVAMTMRMPHWAQVDPATLCRYERGATVPTLTVLFAVAVAYGIAAHELLALVERDLRQQGLRS